MADPEVKETEVTETPQPEVVEVALQPEIATPQPEVKVPAVAPVAVQPPSIQLNVEPAVAMNITVQEFDKKIAESEANTAELKKQRAAYIYDTNVQILIAQAQAQQQPASEGTQG